MKEPTSKQKTGEQETPDAVADADFEIWSREDEEFRNIEEELDIDTDEAVEIERLEDLDGWETEDLEEGIRRRRDLLGDDFDPESPEKSVMGLSEEQESLYHSTLHSIADFIDHEESLQQGILNLGAIFGAYKLSENIHQEAIEMAASAPQDEFWMPGILSSYVVGFGTAGAAKIGFDRGRSKLADRIRPSNTGDISVISEGGYEEFNELLEDSGAVEVQSLTGTAWEIEDTQQGSWFHDYLSTRHEDPRLYNVWFEYDEEKEELRYAFDLIVDWNDECPVEIGDESLGGVEAYRFRGTVEEERPSHMNRILKGREPNKQESKTEEFYGERIREVLDEFGYFENSFEVEREKKTRPEGRKAGDPGVLTRVEHYPLSSDK